MAARRPPGAASAAGRCAPAGGCHILGQKIAASSPPRPARRPGPGSGRRAVRHRRPACLRFGQGEFGHVAEFSRLITVPATAAITMGAKAWTAKWRSTTSSAKKRPGDGRVEAGRDGGGHGAAQQVAPGDAVGVDPVGHPGRDHPGQMHHRPLAARRAARGQRDQRGQRRGEPARTSTRPSRSAPRPRSRRRPRAPAVIGEAVQDQPHHQPADDRDSSVP
jgi:hypothetical protein